jgi:hypothetical protein
MALVAAAAGAAVAAEPPDPGANIPIGQLPASCSAGTSAGCENAVVYYLDRARADMGLPPYALPADFTQLPPDRQIFILSELDRVAYSLTPIEGLNTQLSEDSAEGVAIGDDPHLGSWSYGWNAWYANWAGGYVNAPAAYYDWMYNDGYGSGNLACRQPSDGGCWGHRHDVFGQPGEEGDPYQEAMGAATGHQSDSGERGYAMLIVGVLGEFEPQPPYYYTWAEARADGAGTYPYDPGVPDLSSPGEPSFLTPRLRLVPGGGKLRVVGDAVLLGRRVTMVIRREIVPCAVHFRARRCAWTKRGPVRRFGLTLSSQTAIPLRRPSAWERIVVRARVAGFELGEQRYTAAVASLLLRGPKPHRRGR